MKTRRTKWIFAICFCAFAAIAAVRDITQHRTGAGTFTAGAWALAESTEGRFSVLMPGPFDDYTQKSNTSDSLRGFYLRSRLPDGTLISALRAEYGDAATSTRNCQRMRDANPFGTSLKSRRSFRVGAQDAVELTVNDGRTWMAMRVICLETEGMVLQIATPIGNVPQAESIAPKFFESLKIHGQ